MTRTTFAFVLFLLSALAASLVATGPRAQAQDAAAEPAPADATTGAATATAPADPPPDPAVAEAMERYADANGLFERGDFRGALAEMQRVLELLEGNENQYIVLYNLGRVYEELHRYDLAVTAFQRFLDEAPADAPDRSDADASLRALDRLLGTVAITVDVEHAEVWVGEWQVGEAPGEIRVPSGVHLLELRAEGHETVRRQIEITARTRLELTESLPVLSDFHGLDPALFVSSTALAVVAAAVGATLGGMSLSLSNDSAACATRPGCSIANVTARRREVADLSLGADILYGTAGLFAVTAIVLVFVTDWGGRPAPASAEASAFRVVPRAGPDGGGVTLDVRF
jgi:tetratricopeptide (TPR) repeat protein